MKKSNFVKSATTAVLLLLIGIWCGIRLGIWQEERMQRNEESIQTTIAVVNLDTGAAEKNYAEAIIQGLGSDYVMVSASAAQSGYEAGTYGAVLTFPVDFSENVVSINTSSPSQSVVEFKINHALPTEKYINLYTQLLDLQAEISRSVSYAYIETIFNELHAAQDKSTELLKNEKDNRAAVEYVKLGDYVVMLDLGDIPHEEFSPEELVLDKFVAQAQTYAEQMSQEYVSSYALAQADFDIVEAKLAADAQTIVDSSSDWETRIFNWGDEVTQYGRQLQNYDDAARAWLSSAGTWADGANLYRTKIMEWLSKTEIWVDAAKAYVENTIAYKGRVDSYYSEVENYRNQLNQWKDSTEEAISNLRENQSSLENYSQQLLSIAQGWKPAIDTYNQNISNVKDFAEAWQDYAQKYAAHVADPTQPCPPQPPLTLPNPIETTALQTPDAIPAPSLKVIPELVKVESYTPPVFSVPVSFDVNMPEKDPLLQTALNSPPSFDANMPDNMVSQRPEKPQELSDALTAIVADAASYNPEDYLNDSVKSKVLAHIDRYINYLGTVKNDISKNYSDGIKQLNDIYQKYNLYVSDLRSEITETHSQEQDYLKERLNILIATLSATSTENEALIGSFALKLPYSRNGSVTNKDVVEATIAPVNVVNTGVSTGSSDIGIPSIWLIYIGAPIILFSAALFLWWVLRTIRQRRYEVTDEEAYEKKEN